MSRAGFSFGPGPLRFAQPPLEANDVAPWDSALDGDGDLRFRSDDYRVARRLTSPDFLSARGLTAMSSGKHAFDIECAIPPQYSWAIDIGLVTATAELTFAAGLVGPPAGWTLFDLEHQWATAPFTVVNSVEVPLDPQPVGTRRTLAVDCDAGKVWLALNGVYYGDPAAGTGEAVSFTPGTPVYPAAAFYRNIGGMWTLRDPLSLPAGFSTWA